MLFNSFQFVVFFPVVTILYFLIPGKWRWLHLLFASCLFYAAFIPEYILILLFTIIVDYVAGIMIDRSVGRLRLRFLLLSIIANVLILAVFKYYNFFIGNLNWLGCFLGEDFKPLKYLSIILPIGLSFHTFQAMSYTIEVYRGKFPPERHFGYYALYVMFYPQLVAGPIERPQNVLPQLRDIVNVRFDHERFVSGMQLVLWGLVKKVVIADRLAAMVNEVYDHTGLYTGFSYVLATFFFGIQIYCDFSGYSDIALGTSRVMGVELMKNFDAPYFSSTVSEFWRRWHISLSTWFRDYLYIPLGGNKVGEIRRNLNLFIVFLVSGFWHGASWNFVIWGGVHGLYLIGANYLHPWFPKLKNRNLGNILVTFILVNFAWIFFRAASFSDAWHIITHLADSTQGGGYFSLLTSDYMGNMLYLGQPMWKFSFSLLLIFFLFFMDFLIGRRIFSGFYHRERPLRWTAYILLILAILILGVFDTNQFIYFQF